MDMTDNKKDRANKSITVCSRKCEVIAQNSSYRFSAIGGSTASAQSLPSMLIFPGTSFTLGPAMGGPKSSTGLPATIHHNGTGGATCADDTMLGFVQQNVLPNVVPKPSETLPLILILDGHGSRMTVHLLDFCREHHIIIILRPPHTTHITHPQNTHNFAKLKVLWRKEKFHLLSHRAVCGNRGVSASLSPADAMSCLKKPSEAAFDPQVNAAGWRATGLAPFTRRSENKLLAEVRDRAVAGDLLVQPSVQEHPESLVIAMFPAQLVGDSLAQAGGSSICLHSGMFSNRGPVTETVVYDEIKEIVVVREQKEQAKQDRKRKREEVFAAKREQALQGNGRVLSLLQQGTRLSQLSCKQL